MQRSFQRSEARINRGRVIEGDICEGEVLVGQPADGRQVSAFSYDQNAAATEDNFASIPAESCDVGESNVVQENSANYASPVVFLGHEENNGTFN